MQAEDYVKRINVEEGMRFGKSRAKMHEIYLLCNKQVSHFAGCFKPSHLVEYVDSVYLRTKSPQTLTFTDLLCGSFGYSINMN